MSPYFYSLGMLLTGRTGEKPGSDTITSMDVLASVIANPEHELSVAASPNFVFGTGSVDAIPADDRRFSVVGQRPHCPECDGTGKVYAENGDGPWDCYNCVRKVPAELSDREWAAQPANLRAGCTTRVLGVGEL